MATASNSKKKSNAVPGKSHRVPIYCVDPWNKHAKLPKTKLFLEVTEEYIQRSRNPVPKLFVGAYLCPSCKARVHTEVSKLMKTDCCKEAARNIEETTEDEEIDNDDEFHDLNVEKRTLASQLEYFGISAEEICQPYISVSAASSLYERIKARVELLKSRLQIVTSTNKPLSPVPLVKSCSKQEMCANCIDLLETLACRFQQLIDKDDMYKLLTCIPKPTTIATVVEKFKCSVYMAKTASHLRRHVGVFQTPSWKPREGLSQDIIDCVKNFYVSDDVSRVDPCLRRTIYVKDSETGEKKLFAKRLIWLTIAELHAEFVKLHPEMKISLTSFYKLKPKHCVWSGRAGYHNTCTCQIHENFRLMLEAASITADLNDVFSDWFCSTGNDACMFNLCEDCPNFDKIDKVIDNLETVNIKFEQWGNVQGLYGVQLQHFELDIDEFRERLKSSLCELASHHYILQKQKSYIKYLKEELVLQKSEAILHVDFAQNYEFIIQNAVAGYHWSTNQATVHPFVLTWASKETKSVSSKAYVVISNELSHSATTFHAFRYFVITKIQQEGHMFQKLHFVSDGAGSQYKNYKNIVNLMFHEKDFGIKASHTFTASYHGKGPCDAAGATLKSACRRASLKFNPKTKKQSYIRTAEEMATFARSLNSETFEVLYVTADDVLDVIQQFEIEKRYERATTIPGTRIYHSYDPISFNDLQVKRYSTSCTDKTFKFIDIPAKRKQKPKTNQYVAIKIGAKFSLALVVDTNEESAEVEVQIMNQKGKANSFFWPKVQKCALIACDEVIAIIPKLKVKCNSDNLYEIEESQYKKIKQSM